MLVSFYFDCPNDGRYVDYLESEEYPNRNWPKFIICIKCGENAERIPVCDNFSPDKYWSGVPVKSLGLPNVTSRDYLKRYMKTEHLTKLTDEEHKTMKSNFKSKEELLREHLDKPSVAKARRDAIVDVVSKS